MRDPAPSPTATETGGPLTDVAQGADACDATMTMQHNVGSSASPSWKE